jgi:hypothetical protein
MIAPAHRIKPGSLILGAEGPALKAERDGKDYINHYLVPLAPAPGLALIYIDPERELEWREGPPALDFGPALPADHPAEAGDLVVTARGSFLKVHDIKKDGQRHLAYIDLATGLILPRQERGAARETLGCYRGWCLIKA